jgi:hypothetical protein
MKAIEVTADIIGKRCKSIFTAMMVSGVIEDIRITEHTAEVKVRFDEPHRWGDCVYATDWAHARLLDEVGSLQYLEIIDDGYKTISVTFSEPIRDIDRMFVQNYSTWSVVNLKEWIDNYDTSRFTQTGDCRAVITSEINMECIEEWLHKNTSVHTIEKMI